MVNLKYRKSQDEVKELNEKMKEEKYLNLIFNSLTSIGLVLNEMNQIVYVNQYVMNIFNDDDDNIIGLRLGEFLGCIHNKESKYGCGMGISCKYCEVVKTIMKAFRINHKATNKTQMTLRINGRIISFEIRITANFFIKDSKRYVVVIIQDISDNKKKDLLEKIFFHDILNTASNINGIAKFINETKEKNSNFELIELLNYSSEKLLNQIETQRDLILAENNELNVKYSKINSTEIVKTLVSLYKKNVEYRDYNIILNETAVEIIFSSDYTILYRVLENLIKNAIEASDKKEIISLDINLIEVYIIFKVHNLKFIPYDVQANIFKRAFSTKSVSRGLGTYSVKLLTEEYLNGEVWFKSDKEKGTDFFIKLPAYKI